MVRTPPFAKSVKGIRFLPWNRLRLHRIELTQNFSPVPKYPIFVWDHRKPKILTILHWKAHIFFPRIFWKQSMKNKCLLHNSHRKSFLRAILSIEFELFIKNNSLFFIGRADWILRNFSQINSIRPQNGWFFVPETVFDNSRFVAQIWVVINF